VHGATEVKGWVELDFQFLILGYSDECDTYASSDLRLSIPHFRIRSPTGVGNLVFFPFNSSF